MNKYYEGQVLSEDELDMDEWRLSWVGKEFHGYETFDGKFCIDFDGEHLGIIYKI